MTQHYVIWSGGLDSTVLLDQVIKNNSQDTINTITIDHDQVNQDQKKLEKKARERYTQYIQKQRWYKGIDRQNVITINATYGILPCGYDQAVTWLIYSLPYIYDYSKSIVHFGYIKHDDFWHGRYQFIKAFENLTALKNEAELSFDLEWMTKAEILKYANTELPKGCYWYCEYPRKWGKGYRICGTCSSCKRHHMAEYELEKYYSNVEAVEKAKIEDKADAN